ncbi:uncharacterized protein LOC133716829 [Rosa rugosa]|uniref:uncharacterized protein LOC133716827 n=1 Tax=Rosa rugosa TaxID=74645 RepID=UPI002B40EC46|nr:uncharacterized protein LOC133716827 [Rosa rugosa]XP_061999467.1 uncharacterized protein LOC133716829 [Rosa rugosa]
MAKKELVQEPKFKCFCRREFATQEGLDGHVDSSEPCKAYRDKGHGQFKRKAGLGLERKFRLITIQLRNAKEKAEAAETGGNSNAKKKGGKAEAAETGGNSNAKKKGGKGKGKGKGKGEAGR